jgi:hypothetical protein
MDLNQTLLEDKGELFQDPGRYRYQVGKLNYLTITKPDISYTISVVSQFMEAPRVSHWKAITRIIRYLKRPLGLMMQYRLNEQLRL